jgi:hypothetical protein
MLLPVKAGWRAWPELDFRRCVVSAIESGLFYRAAAVQLSVSAASPIHWWALEGRQGDVALGRQGGDRTSHQMEAHAERVLSVSAEKSDIALAELRGLFWSMLSKRSSPNCGGSRLAHTNVSVRTTNMRPTSTNVG